MKRILALSLALLLCMVLFLGGCSNDTPTDEPAEPTKGTNQTAAPTAPSGSDDEPGSLIKLPIVDTTATFQIWAYNQAANYGVMDFNDLEAWQELERRTNVHIDWILPPAADLTTSLNLTLNSDQLPDSFMLYYSMLPGGLDKAIEDNYITDITDLVNEYCPNYLAQISMEDLAKGSRTDSGALPGFFGIKRTVQPNWLGPIARKDIMDKLGLNTPYTLDDYHDLLVAFRDYGVECPTTITNTGLEGYLMAAFDLPSGYWYQVNNVVHFAPIEDSFLEYVTLMRDWYNEGLIDRDFYTLSGYDAKNFNTAYTLTGKIALFNTTYQNIHAYMVQAAEGGDAEYELVAVPFPVKNLGDKRHIGSTSQERWQSNIGTISPTCGDPVTLAKWYDYLFSDEGWILSSYGTGTAFTYDETGHPRGNELIYNNPDGLTPYQAMNIYSMTPDIPTLYDWERELLVTLNDNALAAFDIWMQNDDNAYAMPSMIFPTVEESSRFAAIMGDVETYITEMVVKFITGIEPLSKFEEFRQNIYNLGVEEAIAIKQAGLDRYNAR